MQIHTLKPKTKRIKSQQVGRGGKRGKTAGRGTKGQKARSGHKIRPEMRDIIKRLPKLRGRGKSALTSIETKPKAINVGALEVAFNSGDTVNIASLSEKGFLRNVKSARPIVKILANGDLTKKLNVTECLVSIEAKAKIEKVGGTVAPLVK